MGKPQPNVLTAGGRSRVLELVMTVDTGIYAAGDLLADTQELTYAFRVPGGSGIINSISVLDPDDQTAFSFDVLILKSNTSLGTENSAPNVSDTNARQVVWSVPFATTDVVTDVGGAKQYARHGLGIPIQANLTTETSIWVALVMDTGTPTFAGGVLVLKLGILQD